jgi:hypothetical protein
MSRHVRLRHAQHWFGSGTLSLGCLPAIGLCLAGCVPSSDLDARGRGTGTSGTSATLGSLAVADPADNVAGTASAPNASDGAAANSESIATAPLVAQAPSADNAAARDPAAPSPGADSGAGSDVPPDPSAASAPDAGSAAPSDPGPPSAPLGPPLDANGFAVALPNDLVNPPIGGEIVFSDDATWEVDSVFQPTFEIHTPTASYWIVKPLGTMVSLEDAAATPAQWIAFSSGFRPSRGVPALTTPPAAMTTVRDEDSQTPTHLRLTSTSADGLWEWVWDFYITHVTFTVNRAPAAFGFAYRGVPGGSLGTEDVLVTSDQATHPARNSFDGDLPGPTEWAFISDTTLGRSIFMMQHTDDALPEHYQVRDNDSSFLQFGTGQITSVPIRFSLGLIDSTTFATVAARVQFVADATH